MKLCSVCSVHTIRCDQIMKWMAVVYWKSTRRAPIGPSVISYSLQIGYRPTNLRSRAWAFWSAARNTRIHYSPRSVPSSRCLVSPRTNGFHGAPRASIRPTHSVASAFGADLNNANKRSEFLGALDWNVFVIFWDTSGLASLNEEKNKFQNRQTNRRIPHNTHDNTPETVNPITAVFPRRAATSPHPRVFIPISTRNPRIPR